MIVKMKDTLHGGLEKSLACAKDLGVLSVNLDQGLPFNNVPGDRAGMQVQSAFLPRGEPDPQDFHVGDLPGADRSGKQVISDNAVVRLIIFRHTEYYFRGMAFRHIGQYPARMTNPATHFPGG
jgi:hypothetical protein